MSAQDPNKEFWRLDLPDPLICFEGYLAYGLLYGHYTASTMHLAWRHYADSVLKRTGFEPVLDDDEVPDPWVSGEGADGLGCASWLITCIVDRMPHRSAR